MEALAGVTPRTIARTQGAAILGFLVPFAAVVYVGLRGGGYDAIPREQFGAVVWLALLAGGLAGVLSFRGISPAAWTALGLLVAFAAWTGVSIIWTQSRDLTVVELARVATYAGVLAFALALGTRDNLKRIAAGVAAALVFLCLMALASRLHPQWFPDHTSADVLPETISRLSYPVGYWNGLAALVAMAIPLALWLSTSAESKGVRALSAGVIPAIALTGYLTLSRGGAVETVAGLAVLVALHPSRRDLLEIAGYATLGSIVLIWAASQRAELMDGLTGATATGQGDELLLITLAICGLVGGMRLTIEEWRTPGEPPGFTIPRETMVRAATVVVGLVLVAGIALNAPSKISNAWDQFKTPAPSGNATSERLTSASGNGRYQWWSTAIESGKDHPVEGTGPGTFEFTWAQDGKIPGFVRDAHSLYFETFAELGVPGVLLIVGLIGLILTVAVSRTRRADPQQRAVLAAITACAVAFVVATALDWAWELAVIPVAALFLVGALLTSDRKPDTGQPIRARAPMVALGLIGALVVAYPLPAAMYLDASQASARADDLDAALDQAKNAAGWQPYAAAPALQEALVYEKQGKLEEAGLQATRIVNLEPNNWRNWLVLSRIDAKLGNAELSIGAYQRARELNPRSPLFTIR